MDVSELTREQQIEAICAMTPPQVETAIRHLTTGRELFYNAICHASLKSKQRAIANREMVAA